MKITFLGTGSSGSMNNYHSNLLIQDKKHTLLIDAGGDLRHSLANVDLTYKDIDAVYITHGHSDHIGGMEWFAQSTYFDPSCHKPILFCNEGLVDDLWSSALKLGLSTIQGIQCSLSTYFTVHKLAPNNGFTWGSAKFEMVQSMHIMNKYSFVNSFGLMITYNGKKTYITGDTQFNPNQIIDFYNEADLIIQDCETTPFTSGVHAHYNELCTLVPETTPRLKEGTKGKMVLWHAYENVFNEHGQVNAEWAKKAEDDGFKGFASKGQVIEL